MTGLEVAQSTTSGQQVGWRWGWRNVHNKCSKIVIQHVSKGWGYVLSYCCSSFEHQLDKLAPIQDYSWQIWFRNGIRKTPIFRITGNGIFNKMGTTSATCCSSHELVSSQTWQYSCGWITLKSDTNGRMAQLVQLVLPLPNRTDFGSQRRTSAKLEDIAIR